MFDSFRPHRLQHARLPCPSPTTRACSNHVRRVGNAIQPSNKVPIYFIYLFRSPSFVLFCFFTLFYNTVLVLPYINMNPPRVYFKSFFVFSSFLHPSNVEDVRSCVTFFSVWFNVVFSGFGIYRYLIFIFY